MKKKIYLYKVSFVLIIIAVVILGIKYSYFSGSKVLANPEQEINIDTGLTPDISMTIPKDATSIIEPEIDKIQYKDYVQGSDVSRVSVPNTFSLYSSRDNYNGTVLASANNIIPIPSGGFIVCIYDAQTIPSYGRRILYYLDNEGKVLGYYDVKQSGTRFEDITNLSTYEKDGRFYFSVMGYISGQSYLFNMSVDISGDLSVTPDKKFKQEKTSETGMYILGSLFDEVSINGKTVPNVTFSKLNNVEDAVLKESNLVTISNPFISYNIDTNTFSKIEKDVQIYNPAQTKDGNLAGYPGFDKAEASSVAIDYIKKIDDDNYLITTRAYRYKLGTTTNEYLEVKSVCLYDANLKFKERLYSSSVGNNNAGTVTTINYFSDINDSGKFYFYSYSSIEKGHLFEINVKNETKITSKLEYPEGTSLILKNSEDPEKYSYILNTKGDLLELSKYGINKPSIVSGDMDKDFTIENTSIFEVPSGQYTLSKIISLNDVNSDPKFAIFGTVRPDSINELSKVFTQHLPSDSFTDTQQSYTYFGTFSRKVDYAPIVKRMPSIIYDINQKNSDQDIKNERLLKDVVVYDTNDSNSASYGQEWLNTRFQKNPLSFDINTDKYTQDIDWENLGFEDNNEAGPNKVTYFATDSNLSRTSTSRIVNKVDKKTKYDETTVKAALRAENFTINLTDLKSLQESGGLTEALLTGEKTTSTYGNVLAWDLEKGTNYNGDVTVDVAQLKAINSATGFKQYPLTYTLKKNGEAVTKETYVYVMDKNSESLGTTDQTKTIFNTEDFVLPWDTLQELKSDKNPQTIPNKIKSEGKVIAYDFETGKELSAEAIVPLSTEVETLKTIEPSNAVGATDAQKKPTQTVHYTIKRTETESTGAETEVSLSTSKYTTITVIYRFATVTLTIKDEESKPLYNLSNQSLKIDPVVISDQIVGKTINFTTNTAISNAKTKATTIPKTETEPAKSTGYVFDDYYDGTNTTKLSSSTSVSIKYKAADTTTDPNAYIMRFKGLLYLNVPNTISFGTEKVRAFTQTVKPEKDNNALIVADQRKVGTKTDTDKKGQWTVSVKLASDFTQTGDNGPKLTNILYYDDSVVSKTTAIIIKETKTGGTKTEIPLNDKSLFRLKIPTGTAISGDYEGTLQWIILNAP